MKRRIIEIDEEKCDGCGLCVEACHEGAIQLIGGKARLVSETYCDGLGDCIGECPRGAIAHIERDVPEFDPVATVEHLKKIGREPAPAHGSAHAEEPALPCGCPGSASRSLVGDETAAPDDLGADRRPELRHWPVQLTLVPAHAPYLRGADVALVADCVPFAYPEAHRDIIRNRAVLVACPKLDDFEAHRAKLTEILKVARPRSLVVYRMEVPCCGGLTAMARHAVADSGVPVPVSEVVVGVRGEVRV
ncbi:MAG: 4Fe-4S ferredoxin [Candidatus Coatesbacteria bacterium RBG_13_66_14]|uniref:4Fe-4S ferredoxin n=1 Tax=Candidatus Coatesbacteria bacterium RBG_13_66_14 TaxID=1817816 RepID=A0A1F5F5Q4_9BACT|nr:MAG: 4Fe-4S ferredoxin [Candidatus Coatesbacteria bacterium RBG_13_66_14]